MTGNSVVHVLDDAGATVKKGRIEPNSLGGFAGFFSGFPAGSVRAVFESSMNWGYLYDLLHDIEAVADVTLANPYKTRIIAEAKIKTDSRPQGDSQPKGCPEGERSEATSMLVVWPPCTGADSSPSPIGILAEICRDSLSITPGP